MTNTNTNATTRMTVANIILKQIEIGVKMSMGFKSPMADELNGNPALTFKCRLSGTTFGHTVKIGLNAMDTYDIQVIYMPRSTSEPVISYEISDVYVEQLNHILLEIESEMSSNPKGLNKPYWTKG